MQKAHVPFYVEQVAVRASCFTSLAEMAIRELSESARSEIVCGPITTGGLNNTALNMLVFNYAVGALQWIGRPVWSQLPYEAGLADLELAWKIANPAAPYCHPILTEFYEPIFKTGLIKQAWFLNGWQSSSGARWEYDFLKESGCIVAELPQGWLDDYNMLRNLD